MLKQQFLKFCGRGISLTALLNPNDAGRCVQSQHVSAGGPGLLLLLGELNKEGM